MVSIRHACLICARDVLILCLFTFSDLKSLLQETGGDVELAATRISEGMLLQHQIFRMQQ